MSALRIFSGAWACPDEEVDKRKKNSTRWGVVVEKPAYDVTIFKVHYGKMTLKIYTKGERVLRVEVIVHNTKEYRWGRSLPCFSEIVLRLRSILERFLDAVGCIDACFVSDDTMENLPQPTHVGQTKVGGIANMVLAAPPDDIKKLRGKDMVRKLGASRRYQPLPQGLRALTALVVLLEKVVRPLLAAALDPSSTPNYPTRHPSINITKTFVSVCRPCTTISTLT
jgi:hypothetical protein